MPPKKIYLVRHGQTKFNELGIVQGRGINASLNEKGRDQADKFYQTYRQAGFEKIFISTLKRTYESVQLFIGDGIPYQTYEGLDEISWGSYEGVEVSAEGSTYFRSLVNRWRSGQTDVAIEGGESPEEVAERQRPVIEALINATEQKILVCMHGRAMRIILCQMLNLPLTEMDEFGHANLGLYILEFADGQFDLKLNNDTSHFN